MNLKILRIKKSIEFKNISNPNNKKSSKFFAQTLILIAQPTNSCYFQNLELQKNTKEFCRVGFTVSKKVGNSVVRNKAKRRLKAAFLELAELVSNHYDYVIIARPDIAKVSYLKICSDLKFCLKRINKPK